MDVSEKYAEKCLLKMVLTEVEEVFNPKYQCEIFNNFVDL